MENFKRKIIINILWILFIVVLGFLFLGYLNDIISRQVKEIIDYRKNIEFYNKSLANLAKLKSVSSDVELYQNKLKLLLPPKDNLIDLPRWISDVSRASGVAVNFSFRGGGKEASLNEVGFENFSLEISGSLAAIEKFLYNIEVIASKFILNFDNFSLAEIGKDNYQLVANGRVFFMNQ